MATANGSIQITANFDTSKVESGIQSIIDSLQTLAERIGEAFDDTALQNMKQLCADLNTNIDSLGSSIGTLSDVSPDSTGLMDYFGDVSTMLGLFTSVIELPGKLAAVSEAFAGVAAAAAGAGTVSMVSFGLIAAAIIVLIGVFVLLVQNWDTVKEKAIEVWTTISNFLTGLWETITETTIAAWQSISDFITELWTGISDTASEIWTGIQGVWTSVAQWFTDNVVTPVVTAFGTLRDGVKKAWEDLWTGIKTIINNYILTGIESFINFIISGVNGLINLLNTIHIDVPDWITDMTGIKTFGFHLTPLSNVVIPRLAQGAVIPPNRRFIAVLGDQTSGTNIETPLDTMVEAFKTALSQMGSAESGNLTVTMPVYLDSERIYEGQKSVQLRRGASIVSAGVTV